MAGPRYISPVWNPIRHALQGPKPMDFNPLMQGLNSISQERQRMLQNERANALLDIQKQKAAREQATWEQQYNSDQAFLNGEMPGGQAPVAGSTGAYSAPAGSPPQVPQSSYNQFVPGQVGPLGGNTVARTPGGLASVGFQGSTPQAGAPAPVLPSSGPPVADLGGEMGPVADPYAPPPGPAPQVQAGPQAQAAAPPRDPRKAAAKGGIWYDENGIARTTDEFEIDTSVYNKDKGPTGEDKKLERLDAEIMSLESMKAPAVGSKNREVLKKVARIDSRIAALKTERTRIEKLRLARAPAEAQEAAQSKKQFFKASADDVAEYRKAEPAQRDAMSQNIAGLERLIGNKSLDKFSGPEFGKRYDRATLANFNAEYKQLQAEVGILNSATFRQVFESLKGGGQITEAESAQAKAAYLAALDDNLTGEQRRKYARFAMYELRRLYNLKNARMNQSARIIGIPEAQVPVPDELRMTDEPMGYRQKMERDPTLKKYKGQYNKKYADEIKASRNGTYTKEGFATDAEAWE